MLFVNQQVEAFAVLTGKINGCSRLFNGMAGFVCEYDNFRPFAVYDIDKLSVFQGQDTPLGTGSDLFDK